MREREAWLEEGREAAGQGRRQSRGVRVGTNGFAWRYNISGYSREWKLVAIVDDRGQRKEQLGGTVGGE